MRSVKAFFKEYLSDFLREGCKIPGITEDFNVRTGTVTNCMEVESGEDTTFYATVHHLLAIEEEGQMFPLLFGGKYRFVCHGETGRIKSVMFDPEYVSGNTYLVRGTWLAAGFQTRSIPGEELQRKTRTIRGEELRRSPKRAESVEDVVYRFFWALDTVDGELFRETVSPDIRIERAGVNGDAYYLDGVSGAEAFLEQDKRYYAQNQYSVHIRRIDRADEKHASVTAWHLYPANTGNKHLGSANRYSQFYNEIIEMELAREKGWVIKNVRFRRKENTVPYGYEILEL